MATIRTRLRQILSGHGASVGFGPKTKQAHSSHSCGHSARLVIRPAEEPVLSLFGVEHPFAVSRAGGYTGPCRTTQHQHPSPRASPPALRIPSGRRGRFQTGFFRSQANENPPPRSRCPRPVIRRRVRSCRGTPCGCPRARSQEAANTPVSLAPCEVPEPCLW